MITINKNICIENMLMLCAIVFIFISHHQIIIFDPYTLCIVVEITDFTKGKNVIKFFQMVEEYILISKSKLRNRKLMTEDSCG